MAVDGDRAVYARDNLRAHVYQIQSRGEHTGSGEKVLPANAPFILLYMQM